MKKALILSVFLLGGCCMSRVCDSGGHEMCYVENSGWKLFNCVPVASGDPAFVNRNQSIWFEDTVTLDTNMELLKREMKKRGATSYRDIISYRSEEQVFILFLKRNTLHTSAEILK